MKKLFCLLICLILCTGALVACKIKGGVGEESDAASVYCSKEYDAGFGNYGFFAVSAIEEDVALETSFDDLTKFKLGGAFEGMTISSVNYDEENAQIVFAIEGVLASGRYGTLEGEGIAKNGVVKVDIPIFSASASTESTLYDGVSEQQIRIDLLAACFQKTVSAEDFILKGAARNMTVKSVSTECVTDEDGNDLLSQTAVITLVGRTDGTDYAYLEILPSATTYNDSLTLVLNTEYCGAVILSDYIDTFEGEDVVYVEARNVKFRENISPEDLVLTGALKDYATVEKVDFVNETLLGIHLAFSYTFVGGDDIGYIGFDASTNEEGMELICSAIVAAPELNYSIQIAGKNIKIDLSLAHSQFNMLEMYPFDLYYSDGREVFVSGLETVNIDGKLSISFVLPDDCSGILYFTISDAYDVVKADGSTESITVTTYFYV